MKIFLYLLALTNTATFAQHAVHVSRTLCDSRPVFFSYQNYFDDQVIYHQLEKDSSWYHIKTQTPVMLVFSRSFSLYPVYAFPGDTIRLACTGDATLPYSFSGNQSWASLNVLAYVNVKTGLLFPAIDVKITKRLNLMYRSAQLDSLHKKRTSIIDSMMANTDLTRQEFFNRTSYFRTLTDKLSPFYQPGSELKWRDIPLPYLDMVNRFSDAIGKEAAPSERSYRAFLWNYNKYLIRDVTDPQSNYAEMFYSANHNFSGAARDYLLFISMKSYINSVVPENDSLLTTFHRECQDQRFVHYIDSLLERRRRLTDQPQLLRTPLGTPEGKSIDLAELLSYHRGKFLYIDFWASWCGPCIYEIPFLKEAESKFGENVDFVSISIDTDLEKWKNAMRKHNTGDRNQYVLDRESELAKYLKLDAIPRFLFMSPDGKVINWDAPRPSNKNDMANLAKNPLR